MYSHEGPVLSVDWSKDGSKIVSAGADKAARLYDLQTMQASQVAAHDAPIRSVRWVDSPSGPILVTGSWDKTVKVDTTTFVIPCLIFAVLGHEVAKSGHYRSAT